MDRFVLHVDEVYDDAALVLGLGLTHATLARARRAGYLRATRKGNRTLYRGQWVIDWLEANSSQPADAPRNKGGAA